MTTTTDTMPELPTGHTRAERLRQPLATDVLVAVADQHGLCIRPFTMKASWSPDEVIKHPETFVTSPVQHDTAVPPFPPTPHRPHQLNSQRCRMTSPGGPLAALRHTAIDGEVRG